jgi:pyruvate-ferredoxin/flavodoxin oxidoreductase
MQKQIIDKQLKFYVIDAYDVARETGMGVRINTIMQTCFFAISGILPQDEAIAAVKDAIKKTYGKRGKAVVQKNFNAVDQTVANLHRVEYPDEVTSTFNRPPVVPAEAPEFVQHVTATMMARKGDDLPVSALPNDGTYPTATTRWEKRNIALEIPVWDPEVCIQCGKCVIACPHAVIRMKAYDPSWLERAPETFKSTDAKGREFSGLKYTIQVAPEDCTGCAVCVFVCPAKNKEQAGLKAINMAPQPPLRYQERENWDFFLDIPDYDRSQLKVSTVKGSQFLRPLFEFSGACAGCGETPYVKLLSQLFGDRAVVANATGCSSIYGGNLPTTPWAQDANGRGPAWSNSLFEDNAEFGFGFRLTLDKQREYARELLLRLRKQIGATLVDELYSAEQASEEEIAAQRKRVAQLKERLSGIDSPEARGLLTIADALVKRSVWIVGGDGWAYDIGYGGLDHVLASGRNVNVLVLDTEVYSNTGGQMSKATPRAAVAKFAAGGKPLAKKDLGMMAVTYGNVYVAQVAMGASDNQTVKAFIEAESYDGPSLIIAYSHCIAHGVNMEVAFGQHQLAVDCGHWPLYRYDPRRAHEGKNPLQLDSKAPKIPFKEYAYNETRFKMLAQSKPEAAAQLLELAQGDVIRRWRMYEHLAAMDFSETTE